MLNESYISNNQSTPDVVPQLTRSKSTQQKWWLHRLLYARVEMGKSEQRLPELPFASCTATAFALEWGPLWHQPIYTITHCSCRMVATHRGEKTAPPCCPWAELPTLHRILPTPGRVSPCQPAKVSDTAPTSSQSSWHLSPLLCCRSLQAIAPCLAAFLSNGHCNQSLTPLTGETLGTFMELHGWTFVAIWSFLCKGFGDCGD